MILAVLIVAGVAAACPAPTHYDGDAIRCASADWRALAGGRGMRLHAVDAPEIDCGGRRAPCTTAGGIAARDALRTLTARGPTTCTWTGDWAPGWHGPRPVVDCAVRIHGRAQDLACAQLRGRHAVYELRFDPGGTWLRRCRP